MKYIFLITCIIFMISCDKRIESYKKEANDKLNKLLVKALNETSAKFDTIPYVEFEKMDTIQFDSIFDMLTSEGAAALYQSDMALYTTEDCVPPPSEIQEAKEKEMAMKDSIYYEALTNQLKELREEENMDYFSHFELLVYQRRMNLISLEMASFCPSENFENFKNWRERIKRD